MSIKIKLTMIMSFTVLFILLLSLGISYYTHSNNLRQNIETQMMMVAEQVAIAVEQSHSNSRYVEHQLEDYLRLSSILISKELDANIDNITNEQLVDLSKDIGVSNISLMIRTRDDIVVAKSSNPSELGQSRANLEYRQGTLFQLFKQLQSTSHLDYFWTDPFEYSSDY